MIRKTKAEGRAWTSHWGQQSSREHGLVKGLCCPHCSQTDLKETQPSTRPCDEDDKSLARPWPWPGPFLPLQALHLRFYSALCTPPLSQQTPEIRHAILPAYATLLSLVCPNLYTHIRSQISCCFFVNSAWPPRLHQIPV